MYGIGHGGIEILAVLLGCGDPVHCRKTIQMFALIPEEVFMANMRNTMERSLEKQDG